MNNKIKKYNAVVRIRSNTTCIIKERGFESIAEAENAYWFVADIADEYDIFYRREWYAGMDMPEIDAEYWFGKRNKRETE